MKPFTHAKSSARKWGGIPEDYLDIHDLMDSSKGAFADNRHRTLTHNAWFLSNVLEKIFGHVRKNSEGREYSIREIGEQHVLEDFGYIPSVHDYLAEMPIYPWLHGYAQTSKVKEVAPSAKKMFVRSQDKNKEIRIETWKD